MPASCEPMTSHAFSAEESARYARHLTLPEVGTEGQSRLRRARVLLVGAGGLGSPAALYLAAAGVGTLGLVDFDRVDASNLQRQVLHGTPDVGRLKLESARDRLHAINPNVHLELHPERLTAARALDLLRPYDIVLDGTDNFATRYLVNDACALLGKPNVYGSVFRFEGQASVFWAARGPCYRCLYPEPPPPGAVPNCAEGGVLGVLPGLIGVLQATEAIKLIVGCGQPLIGRLLVYDALPMTFRTLNLRKDPDCPLCGTHPTITALQDYEQLCGTAAPQENAMDITPAQLKSELDAKKKLVVLDVREPVEWNLGHLPGATWIPLGDLPARVGELSKASEIVCYCKAGGRSARAMQFLQTQGFTKVRNLAGGILAWSDQVDPSIPKY